MAALEVYLERLPVRIAEFKLAMADAATVPHMEKNARQSTLKAWRREASMNRNDAKIVSPARLKLMGIGVRTSENMELDIKANDVE